MITLTGRYTNALLTIDEFEESLITQIYNMINHVTFNKQVVIMPDGHAGKGSCVGFTMPLGEKVNPSTIGVDIGCGLLSVNIGSELNMSLKELDEEIRTRVPMGINIHETKSRIGKLSKFSFSKHFPWKEMNDNLKAFFVKYNKEFNTSFEVSEIDYRSFVDRFKTMRLEIKRVSSAIGTLGGGNHFIEVSKSRKTGDYWVTVHSGSRNFGKVICEHHENVAKKKLDYKRNVLLKTEIEYILKNTVDKSQIPTLTKEAKKKLDLDSDVNLKGMEYLEGEDLKEYFIDMVIAQVYASFNRKHMMDIMLEIINSSAIESIESIHNFIDFRDFTIRKGAIRSYVGEKMVIPFNMRDGILICEGKDNSEWNFSAPHGAGRVLSRSKAKEKLSLVDFEKQMQSIYSTSICQSVLDEAPDAYKDTTMIENAIEPTANILDKLIPVLNIKDKSSGMSWKERKEAKKKSKEKYDKRK